MTPREYKAFQTVLGNSKPVSISSAIPVMAFSDKNPSKFVNLPVEKLGLLPFGKRRDEISVARLVDVASESSAPKFHDSFGRGASSGPIISSQVHQVAEPIIHQAIDDDKIQVAIHSKGNDLNPPSELTFGFKPIYDSSFEDVSFKTGHQIQQSSGFKSFSPSIQVSTDHNAGFQPVIPEFNEFSVQSHGGAQLGGLVTADIQVQSVPSKFEGIGTLTDDDLELDFSTLGQSSDTALFDISEKEFAGGKGASISQVDSGENLYRHHVPSSLIPTSGAGPGTTAVGKLLASKTDANEIDDSEVFTRSIDSSSRSKKKIRDNDEDKKIDLIVFSEPENNSFRSTKTLREQITPLKIEDDEESVDDETLGRDTTDSADFSSLKFTRQNGAIVLQRSKEDTIDSNLGESADIRASSLFATNALNIPKHPNVQLPLQDVTASEQRNIPQVTSFKPRQQRHQSQHSRTIVSHQQPTLSLRNVPGSFDKDDAPIRYVRIDQPKQINSQSQTFQSSSTRENHQQRNQGFNFKPSSKHANQGRNQKKPPLVPSRNTQSQFQQNRHQQQGSGSFSQNNRQKQQGDFSVGLNNQQQSSFSFGQGNQHQQREQGPLSFGQGSQQQHKNQGSVSFRQGNHQQQQFSSSFVQNAQQQQRDELIPFGRDNRQQPQQQKKESVSFGQESRQQQGSISFGQGNQKQKQSIVISQGKGEQQPIVISQGRRTQKQPVNTFPGPQKQEQKKQPFAVDQTQQQISRPVIQRVELGDKQLLQLQKYIQKQNQPSGQISTQQSNSGFQLSQLLGGSKTSGQKTDPSSSKKNSGTSVVSAPSSFSSLPPSVLQAFGGAGGLAALGGAGGSGGGQPHIIVKSET